MADNGTPAVGAGCRAEAAEDTAILRSVFATDASRIATVDALRLLGNGAGSEEVSRMLDPTRQFREELRNKLVAIAVASGEEKKEG